MIATLSPRLLNSLGIKLSYAEFSAFSDAYEHELDQRIIRSIAEGLQPDQLNDLLARQESHQPLGNWLETNVPDLEDIVEDEMAKLLLEVSARKDEFGGT